ncbi:hypothetical protein M0805_009605 [Coniferiporia weirii]|nr:hypothetical protein M0805_009605 [Coniferiporia weirii]
MELIFVCFLFAAATLAQRVSIFDPSMNQSLTPGQNITVSVVKFDSLTGSTEIGIGIALHHCNEIPCEDASEQLGSILYTGPFVPERGAGDEGQPYQNFSIAIPSSFLPGPAVLSIAHANLVGAGPFLNTEIVNVTINIA